MGNICSPSFFPAPPDHNFFSRRVRRRSLSMTADRVRKNTPPGALRDRQRPGFRTRKEIGREKYALKVLHGDFADLHFSLCGRFAGASRGGSPPGCGCVERIAVGENSPGMCRPRGIITVGQDRWVVGEPLKRGKGTDLPRVTCSPRRHRRAGQASRDLSGRCTRSRIRSCATIPSAWAPLFWCWYCPYPVYSEQSPEYICVVRPKRAPGSAADAGSATETMGRAAQGRLSRCPLRWE